MGLLTDGRPLPWPEAKAAADHVRSHGIDQFLAIYSAVKDRQNDCLKWGDEIEYVVIKLDDENETAKISLDVNEYLKELQKEEDNAVE
eukprot:Awhi_evm1s2786